MHGRATRTRAWCGHVHAHGKDMHLRVATNRAGILLAIMRPGQLKSVTLFMLCFHIFLGNLSLSHNSSFKCFFFCPILRNILSPSSFRSLPVGPCVIGSDRDWCLSTAVVHCSTGDLWSPCPTTSTVSSSIFRRKIGLSEN